MTPERFQQLQRLYTSEWCRSSPQPEEMVECLESIRDQRELLVELADRLKHELPTCPCVGYGIHEHGEHCRFGVIRTRLIERLKALGVWPEEST